MADYSRFLFDSLSGVGDTIADNRKERMRAEFENRDFARQLDLDRDRLMESASERERLQSNADRSHALDLMEFERGAAPKVETFYDDRGGEYKGALQPDGSIRKFGGTKPPSNARGPLTAIDKKAVLEADEGVLAGENAVAALSKAIQLNDKAYQGPAAKERGYLTSIFGSEEGAATEALTNIITGQALESLKATFGGMPTEGERKVLLDIQGSVNQAPAVRKDIWTRARSLAARRIAFNRDRAAELRGGTFYQGGDAGPVQGTVPAYGSREEAERVVPTAEMFGDEGEIDAEGLIAEANEAIAQGADPNAVRARLQEMGIDLQ